MPAKRLTPLLLGSSLAATSTLAFALGLGDATPRSALGEPLQLNIPINIGPGEEVGDHCFTLRPTPFNQASGMPMITQGSVSVMRSAAGKAILRVSTSVPVDEPMIALGIETRCKINVARDYSIFLSPRADDVSTTLAADAVWDVPAGPAVAADLASPPAGTMAAADAPDLTQPTEPAAQAAAKPAQTPVLVATLAPAAPIKSRPTAAIETKPAAPARAVAATPVATPATPARPIATVAKAAPAAKPVPMITAVAPVAAPPAATQTVATPQRTPAVTPQPARAAAPSFPATAERDPQLAELNATVTALRAQVAAQEKRLQELSAQQAAPLRVAGQYRPDSVIPATLNVPIARNDAQTVVYRATPVAVPQSSGVSLPTLGIALLVTALAAAGSGHYMGRRAAEGNPGRRGARTGRRPVRRPRD